MTTGITEMCQAWVPGTSFSGYWPKTLKTNARNGSSRLSVHSHFNEKWGFEALVSGSQLYAFSHY